MSHLVSIQTQVRDATAVAAACQRLSLPEPVLGTAELYGGSVNGLIVHLPGWNYPAVIDLATGEVKFDNYGGAWGDPVKLDRFIQMYAVEKAKIEGRKKGCAVTEQAMHDGSIQLQILEAG